MPETLAKVELAPDVSVELITGDGAPEWRLEGDPEAGGLGLIRLLSAAFEDGRGLAVVAARRAGDAAHGDEAVSAFLLAPEGEAKHVDDSLLSTEYDSDGLVRRAGIELWPAEGQPAVRVAADRDGEMSGDASRRATPMAFRIDGVAGRGRYELVEPASR